MGEAQVGGRGRQEGPARHETPPTVACRDANVGHMEINQRLLGKKYLIQDLLMSSCSEQAVKNKVHLSLRR